MKLKFKNIHLSQLFLLLLLMLFTACDTFHNAGKSQSLVSQFKTPPDTTRLSTYWYWINGNISAEGVKKDLIAMDKVGIGTAFIGNIGLDTKHGDSTKQAPFLSDCWWDITTTAFKVADSLGMKIGMFNGPGWSQSGGPWVKPGESMRYLAHNTLQVEGPATLNKKLAIPDSNFQRTAVLAFPTPKADKTEDKGFISKVNVLPHSPRSADLVDGDISSGCLFTQPSVQDSSISISLQLDKIKPVRSLLLYPAHAPFRADVMLQVKKGKDYQTIKSFVFDRTNAQRNVGFLPHSPVVISFPAVKARDFRLVFTHFSANGGLAEIELSPKAYLQNYIEKQLGKMFQTPHPMWEAYKWEDQHTAYREGLKIAPDSVLNITDKISADGILNWKIPKGKWTIMQIGMVPTGVTNAPATPEATGLEVDKMSKKDLQHHFDAFIGKILSRIPEEDRKSFKYVVADSYETGSENWTDGFAKDFKDRYGYDPLPWLPVLSGKIVGSADQSDRFLWDLRRLIADQIAYQYVGGLRQISHEHGLKIWLENYGHWGFPAEFLQYGGQSDLVSGEFWAEGSLGSIELEDASSAAHIYGKNKVYAESFTAAGRTFERYPGYLKKRGDWSFTQGVNSTLLHVYISQPNDYPKPGINAWFGTEFNRKNTWFNMAKPYFDYLRRCNFMLQQGHPVIDVAYYIGESAPVMTGIQKPKLPKGYSFDWMNAEVIENRLTVKNGKLVLPNGIAYSLLVLPPEKTMRPKVLKAIMNLVHEGATILGPRPKRSPSLENYPASDDEVKTLAAKLWQNCDGKEVKMVHYGKGLVLDGMTMQEAFKLLNVVPDFEISSEVPVLYTHRRTENADIYFISNQANDTIHITPSFRVTDKQPEWWDATSGETRVLPQFSQKEKKTSVPLILNPAQSAFMVFRNKADEVNGMQKNFPDFKELFTIKGPWKVTFNSDSAMRGPAESILFPELKDWSKSSNPKIKYYSGKATYQIAFNLSKLPKHKKVYLDLGNVKDVAQIVLNGEALGGVWTEPWQIDVTSAIRQGKNQLQIKVANTWVNRLIGDSKLPEEKRRTYADVNPYAPNSPLQLSGLIGPVTIKYY